MLYTPPPQFQFEYDDTTAGTANIATLLTGIAATAAGSANTKGAWAQIVSATDRDWHGFWLMFSAAVNPTGLNAAQTCDIGIGAAGSEQVLLSDFLMGGQPLFLANTTAFGSCGAIYIPLFIPAGVRVAVRTQAAVASRVARCYCIGQSGASVPVPVFAGCDTYGVNLAASEGTPLPSNAAANAFGTLTNVGSATSRDYKAILMSHQGAAISSVTGRVYLIEGGYGGTFSPKMRVWAGSSANETWTAILNASSVTQNIPAGTQLQARISCGGASNTDQPSVAFHCFY